MKRVLLATVAVALLVVACSSVAVDSVGIPSSLTPSPTLTARPTSAAKSELTATSSATSPAPTPLPPGGAVQSAGLLNATDGWALTWTGLFLTADGGATWRATTVPEPQASAGVLGVDFADPQHGWLATLDSADPMSRVFDVWRTDDGARTWQRVVLPEGANASDAMGTAEFSILDPDHLFLFVEGGMPDGYTGDLFESTDGGLTWSADRFTRDSGVTGTVAFADANHGVVAGGGPGNLLFATSDAGHTWRPVMIPAPDGASATFAPAWSAPTFWDATSGALAMNYGTDAGPAGFGVLVTHNAGASWSLASFTASTAARPAALAFPNPTDSLALPDSTTLLRTSDAGRTWARSGAQGLPDTPTSIFFGDLQHGWALIEMSVCLGFKTDCSIRTELYATVDGGSTWTELWPK